LLRTSRTRPPPPGLRVTGSRQKSHNPVRDSRSPGRMLSRTRAGPSQPPHGDHNSGDLGADRREHRLDLATGQAAELGKYIDRRGNVLIADDLREDPPRLPAHNLCAHWLPGKKCPALGCATFLRVIVTGFHGCSLTRGLSR
jgi:hypothetical protein